MSVLPDILYVVCAQINLSDLSSWAFLSACVWKSLCNNNNNKKCGHKKGHNRLDHPTIRPIHTHGIILVKYITRFGRCANITNVHNTRRRSLEPSEQTELHSVREMCVCFAQRQHTKKMRRTLFIATHMGKHAHLFMNTKFHYVLRKQQHFSHNIAIASC